MDKFTSSSDMAQRLTEYHLAHRNLFKSLIKPGTMPLTQYHILDMLSEKKNMRMGEISQLMSISRPNLTPLVDKLVNMNYVQRIPDNHDRRVTYITLTNDGLDALNAEHRAIESNVNDFLSRLSKEEYDRFFDALEIISLLAERM